MTISNKENAFMILSTHPNNWIIRTFEESDAAAFSRHASSPRIAANMRDAFPHPFSEEAAQRWVRTARQADPPTYFAIAVPEELIGSIGFGIQQDVYARSAEIAYWVAEPYWGRGIASWAVRVVSEYAFTQFDLLRLYAGIFECNPASGRVLQNAGYTLEGRLRQSVVKHGRVMDQLLYARLRSDPFTAESPKS